MFSPYYARARRLGRLDPLQHNAFNVALYGPGRHWWTMTERGRHALEREPGALRIGPSRMAWHGDALEIELDERCAPWPSRVRGHLRLWPGATTSTTFLLDRESRHRWSPVAPLATLEVDLQEPRLRFTGRAYLDTNDGDEPLEDAFTGWHWSRAAHGRERATLHYDACRRDGSELLLAVDIDRDGRVAAHETPPERVPLPSTRWGLARAARVPARVERTLEDGPFYARTQLALAAGGRAMHESLSLERFSRRWVQALLPFRMPRRG